MKVRKKFRIWTIEKMSLIQLISALTSHADQHKAAEEISEGICRNLLEKIQKLIPPLLQEYLPLNDGEVVNPDMEKSKQV